MQGLRRTTGLLGRAGQQDEKSLAHPGQNRGLGRCLAGQPGQIRQHLIAQVAAVALLPTGQTLGPQGHQGQALAVVFPVQGQTASRRGLAEAGDGRGKGLVQGGFIAQAG